MNLDYLKTYATLVEAGSFSGAARELGISQPAVTFQIQKLEKDLGVRLIDRTRRGIVVTQAGERVLDFARRVGSEREGLLQDLGHLRDEVTGELSLAASTIPGEVLLPPLLSRFKELHPGVQARVEVTDSATAVTRVQDGTHDIGFCGVPADDESLEAFKFAEDRIVLIVFPGHPFAVRDEVSVLELADEPFVSREETSGTQRTVNKALARAQKGASNFSPRLILGTHQAVISAVEAGAGLAFVSDLGAEKSLSLGLTKKLVVKDMDLRRNFFCVYRKERLVSRLLEEFVSFVRASVV